MMLYINSNSPTPRNCTQDNTAIVRFASTPTTNSVNISFNARLQVYTTADRFYVYLHNETTNTRVAVLATYQSPFEQKKVEINYSGTQTVVVGNSYSIRFRYAATDGWGVTVDNVLVTENTTSAPSSYVFRLEDGSQGIGKVLRAADDKGNAYWKALGNNSAANLADKPLDNSSDENRDSQHQLILSLQKAIKEQEATFDEQSERIERLELLLDN